MLNKIVASARLRMTVTALLILCAGVLASELFANWQALREMVDLRRAAQDTAEISRLVNELQSERGLSGAYVAAHGLTSRQPVDDQRKLTDALQASAVEALRDFGRFPITANSKTLIEQAAREIETLSQTRGRIDALSISSTNEFSFYTSLIAKLLDVTGDISLTTRRSDVGAAMSAYTVLQQVKERAAQERGKVAAVLAAGRFTPATYQDIVGMISEQAALFEALKLSASPSVLVDYHQALENPAWSNVQQLRQRLLRDGSAGVVPGITGPEWWATTTARIQLMGAIEATSGRELIEIASSIYDQSMRKFVRTAILAFCFLGLTGLALRTSLSSDAFVGADQGRMRGQAEIRNLFDGGSANRVLGERADDIEQAIIGLQAALDGNSDGERSERWAELQHSLGSALYRRIRGDRSDNIERAIGCLEDALVVRTPECCPELWAETSNILAQALLYRVQSAHSQNIERAIILLEAVSKVITPTAFPQHWAETQKILGQAYQDRTIGDRAENLERAISALEGVLTVLTPNCCPRQWAEIQNGLAGAYANRIRGERAENLERAVIAYGAAHSVQPLDNGAAAPLRGLMR
jgi:hypothetical protein